MNSFELMMMIDGVDSRRVVGEKGRSSGRLVGGLARSRRDRGLKGMMYFYCVGSVWLVRERE